MKSDLEKRQVEALERLAKAKEHELMYQQYQKMSEEKFSHEDADNYKDTNVTFAEAMALIVAIAGFCLLFTKVWIVGIIILLIGIFWIFRNYKIGRKKVLEQRTHLHKQVGKKRKDVHLKEQ